MGWHEILAGELGNLVHGRKINQPVGQTLFEGGGTANFRAMAWTLRYGYATRQDHSLIQSARPWAIKLYNVQKSVGHMAFGPTSIEQCAPDPHSYFHLLAHSAMRLFALETKDAEILALNGEWWRWHVALMLRTSDASGKIQTVCTRAEGDPAWGQETLALRVIKGMRIPNGIPIGGVKDWRQWNTALPSQLITCLLTGNRLWSNDKSTIDDMGGSGYCNSKSPLPRLALPFTVNYLNDGGYIAAMDRNQNQSGLLLPVDWIQANGKGDRVGFGRSWRTQPPQLAIKRQERIG